MPRGLRLRRAAFLFVVLMVAAGCGPAGGTPTPPDGVPVTVAPATAPGVTAVPPTAPPTVPVSEGLPDPAALAAQVSAERLMDDVRWLADDARRGRLTGSPEEDEVAAWLAERFQSLGLRPFDAAGLDDYLMPFEVPAITIPGREGESGQVQSQNVIGVLPGAGRSDRYVYLAAHYDGLGICGGEVCNGADDNATGVAAVLEAARILGAAGRPPDETIVFVAFSGEEVGLWGSGAVCDRLATTGQSLVLNLELLGAAKGQGSHVDVWDQEVGSTASIVSAVEWAGRELGVKVERLGRDPGSDARRLVQCGMPAVSLDVAWSRTGHPHYHSPSDDPEYIDVEGFASAARVAVAAAWRLANDGQ